MTEEGTKTFKIMTAEEMEEAHAEELSTLSGAERYGESRYREGYKAGYIAAINSVWELIIDNSNDYRSVYHHLWNFTQYGTLAKWAHTSKDDPHYRSEPDNWPPRYKLQWEQLEGAPKMDVRQSPPAASMQQAADNDNNDDERHLWEARRAQVKRDLEAMIAETVADIAWLEKWLAERRKAEEQQTAVESEAGE